MGAYEDTACKNLHALQSLVQHRGSDTAGMSGTAHTPPCTPAPQGWRALTRGFFMSRRRCGVRPRFFSTARLTLRAPSTVASGNGGAGAGAVYLPRQPGAEA